MVHGLIGPLNYFSPEAHLKGISVHTPDLLGYGPQRFPSATVTLRMQAQQVAQYIRNEVRRPSVVLGHSVGGAVAMLLAKSEPDLVKGLISVEGNFTLRDAFWCGRIAPMKEAEWAFEYESLQNDPGAWLANANIAPTPERSAWARGMLGNQPSGTVQAMARAVVKETGAVEFLDDVRTVVASGLPIYLLSGERSVSRWDVPEWTRVAARADVVLAGVGHMMMLEQPEQFCSAVRDLMGM